MKVYCCAAGHTVSIMEDENGEASYTALRVTDWDGKHTYNFCYRCYGEWAVKQWPLVEEVKK